MPIIMEDMKNQQNAAPVIQYGPKDYNSILTGNGINQGLLRNTILVPGTADVTPQHVITTILQHKRDCTNKAHHVHDDTKSYTVLIQNISLFGGYAYVTPGAVSTIKLPMPLFTNHLMTFRDPATGDTVTFRSRLFVNAIGVYKTAANNYVLPSLMLIAVNENDTSMVMTSCIDTLQNSHSLSHPASANMKDPVGTVYASVARQIRIAMSNSKTYGQYVLETDDSVNLANVDKTRSMYDAIMDEIALIKTPGTLKMCLEALSASSFGELIYAIDLLSRINITFALYQSDVIDIVNARSANEAKSLKNANMSLSLADTLSAMQGQANATIPELAGKHYSTNQVTLTTEQLAAIETDSKITIVAAGAGTGKSSCIMHRLAFMEENGCDMKQTFVLSFTKAAAQHIKKNFKDCKSSTIAEFTHNFINVILDDGSGERVDIISHSDFIQKLSIRMQDLIDAKILAQPTIDALSDFLLLAGDIDDNANRLLDMLDTTMNPEASNLLSILKMLHCTSLELDPIIFHSQLSMVKPNIEHIVIDESQDSNRLEFLTMLKMAMTHNISIYIVGKA